MSVIEHGDWKSYEPDAPYAGFADITAHILYARRDADGKDWYVYIYDDKPFTSGAVVMTVYLQEDQLLVKAATRNPTALFPVNARLIEETSYAGTDPQADFGNKIYDPATGTFSDQTVPMASPFDDIVKRLAALEAKVGGT